MIEVTSAGGRGSVALFGEFHSGNSAEITDVVAALIDQAVTDVTVDLTGISFPQPSTIRALVASGDLLSAADGTMVLVGAPQWVDRVVAAARADHTVAITGPPPMLSAAPGAGQSGEIAEVLRSMCQLRRLLVSASPVIADLRRLVEAAIAHIPGCTAASLTLVASASPRLAVIGDRIVVEIDLADYTADEGPCVDVYRTSERVRVDVVGFDEDYVHLTPLAVNAVLSVPVIVDNHTVGSFDVYSPTRFGPDAATIADIFAGQAGHAITNSDLVTVARQVSGSLQRQADDRTDIAIAEGVVAGLLDVGIDQACELLRSAAVANNETLAVTARTLVASRTHPPSPS